MATTSELSLTLPMIARGAGEVIEIFAELELEVEGETAFQAFVDVLHFALRERWYEADGTVAAGKSTTRGRRQEIEAIIRSRVA